MSISITKTITYGQSFDSLPIVDVVKNYGRIEQRAYLDLGTTSKQSRISEEKDYKPKKLKSERLELRSKSRKKLVEFLTELGQDSKAESMANCGEKFEVLTCGQHIVAKTPYHRCNIRYCPMCGSRRANKYQRKYLPYALDFVKLSSVSLTPCLLTLTQVKIDGERALDSKKRLYKSFRKFIRHPFFNEYFAGGVYAIENSFTDSGNHTHLHCVVFRKKFIDHKLLKEHWFAVSKGAENLNIKRIDSLENGLKECLKYIAKPVLAEKLQLNHVKQLLELAGQRMVDTFGDFRKFIQSHELPEEEKEEREKLRENTCCPNCNDNNLLFALTMTERQLVNFYRQTELTRGSPPTQIH